MTTAPSDRSLLDLLDEQECLRILASEPIGRLGVPRGNLAVASDGNGTSWFIGGADAPGPNAKPLSAVDV